ncbi:hypothetical protein [Marinomonas sp. THO17]|uniref:hypothetical protein n=1 Tax=Marinomonas sp. THO17 TaxID=3149048 RepID=UPI00336BB721
MKQSYSEPVDLLTHNTTKAFQIEDVNAHLTSVAAAYDMLSFLRSSTYELSYQREDRSASFYRGLSLCIEVVQNQLGQGLAPSEEQQD